MSDRPTPETDAKSWMSGDAWEEKDEVVDAEFSRELERERDEARERAVKLAAQLLAEMEETK